MACKKTNQMTLVGFLHAPHRLDFAYFIIVILPMIGSSFTLPVAAFIMPTTAKTDGTSQIRPSIAVIIPSAPKPLAQLRGLNNMAVKIADRIPCTIPHAMHNRNSTVPWLAWNLTNGDVLCAPVSRGMKNNM